MIYIITGGGRGVGKTTWLFKHIAELKNRGEEISGILTPAIYNSNGDKIGFHAFNAADGESWELGRNDKKLEGPGYGPFSFSDEGFVRANDILSKALYADSGSIFLDEIGPLELKKSYGFSSILPQIGNKKLNCNLYLVIRPELTGNFIQRYISAGNYRIIEITLQNRNELILLEL